MRWTAHFSTSSYQDDVQLKYIMPSKYEVKKLSETVTKKKKTKKQDLPFQLFLGILNILTENSNEWSLWDFLIYFSRLIPG